MSLFSLKKINIIGRLTKDPDLKILDENKKVCNFSVAATTSRKKGNEWVDEPEFFEVAVWGNRGETIASRLKKGMLIFVSGDLTSDSYVGKDGKQRFSLRVMANEFVFLDPSEKKKQQNSPDSNTATVSHMEAQNNFVKSTFDDEIPF